MRALAAAVALLVVVHAHPLGLVPETLQPVPHQPPSTCLLQRSIPHRVMLEVHGEPPKGHPSPPSPSVPAELAPYQADWPQYSKAPRSSQTTVTTVAAPRSSRTTVTTAAPRLEATTTAALAAEKLTSSSQLTDAPGPVRTTRPSSTQPVGGRSVPEPEATTTAALAAEELTSSSQLTAAPGLSPVRTTRPPSSTQPRSLESTTSQPTSTGALETTSQGTVKASSTTLAPDSGATEAVWLELELPHRLQKIHAGSLGPIPRFAATLRAELCATAALPKERLVVLDVRGEYLPLNMMQASDGGSFAEIHGARRGKQQTIVDLEVLPRSDSPSAGPDPGAVVAQWKSQLGDPQSELLQGTLSGLLAGATLTGGGTAAS